MGTEVVPNNLHSIRLGSVINGGALESYQEKKLFECPRKRAVGGQVEFHEPIWFYIIGSLLLLYCLILFKSHMSELSLRLDFPGSRCYI